MLQSRFEFRFSFVFSTQAMLPSHGSMGPAYAGPPGLPHTVPWPDVAGSSSAGPAEAGLSSSGPAVVAPAQLSSSGPAQDGSQLPYADPLWANFRPTTEPAHAGSQVGVPGPADAGSQGMTDAMAELMELRNFEACLETHWNRTTWGSSVQWPEPFFSHGDTLPCRLSEWEWAFHPYGQLVVGTGGLGVPRAISGGHPGRFYLGVFG